MRAGQQSCTPARALVTVELTGFDIGQCEMCHIDLIRTPRRGSLDLGCVQRKAKKRELKAKRPASLRLEMPRVIPPLRAKLWVCPVIFGKFESNDFIGAPEAVRRHRKQ